MKKIFAALLALFSSVAFAATFNPVQLLNPAGSTAGQAIVSTGASSAPAWATVPLSGLSSIAANTVLANATGSSAAVTAFAMPSCSGASNALTWTSGSGFVCNSAVNAAQLAGQTFASPTITTPNVVGTTAAGNAAVGSVGENRSATSTAISLTTGTATTITSISLPAGDWYVFGSVAFTATGGTVPSVWTAGISTTAATLPASPLYAQIGATMSANAIGTLAVPMQRVNVSTTTTVYMIAQANYSSGTTGTGLGTIMAVRFSR